MDNNIKAIETSLALTRRCLSLFNGNAASKLQLEDKILKFEILRNRLLHARLAAAPQPSCRFCCATSFNSCGRAVGHCHGYDGHCHRFDEHLRRYYTSSPKVPTGYFNINTCVIQIVD